MKLSTVLGRMRKSKLFMIGLSPLVAITVVCFTSKFWVQWDSEESDLSARLARPDWPTSGLKGHPLGCDLLGRDLLTHPLEGGWVSLKIIFLVTVISMLLGSMTGLVSGYYEGKIDLIIVRFRGILQVTPQLILTIRVVAVMGASMVNLVLTLDATGWVTTTRLVCTIVLGMKNKEFISASKVLGASGK